MKVRSWHVLGIMSGTSLDGIDLCYCRFSLKGDKWSYKILKAHTLSYSEDWVRELSFHEGLSAEDLLRLDHSYGRHLAEVINRFLIEHSISREKVDLISSHGHTFFHQPQNGFTFQLGNGPEIFTGTGIKCVCDFRRQDVALGGQGAPLVPIGDKLLFSEYDACLNLGGFANISFQKKNKRLASDICPVNFVLNRFAQKMGFPFDKGGEIAASAEVDKGLLKQLNTFPYYQQAGPKSLGAEWVHKNILPMLEKSGLATKNIISTYTAHAATQITRTFRENNLQNCLITGGGAFNTHLISQIRDTSETQMVAPETDLIHFKEALVFGLMGVLKITGQTNVLASVTGSSKNHSSGIIYS